MGIGSDFIWLSANRHWFYSDVLYFVLGALSYIPNAMLNEDPITKPLQRLTDLLSAGINAVWWHEMATSELLKRFFMVSCYLHLF